MTLVMAVFAQKPRFIRDSAFADACASALLERLRDIRRSAFASVLWVGGGNIDELPRIKTIGSLNVRPFPVDGEIEHFPFEPASLDLIIVNGTLNVVNDLPGVLIQMRRALKPDGVFMCALPGGETLYELRDVLMREPSRGGVAARVHPTVDLQTFAGLMQRAGFALPVVDAEIKPVFYRQLKTLLRDIKNAGEGLSLRERVKTFVGKKFWTGIEADYRARHASDDNLLRASIEIIYAIGWGPSDAQPKPLRPGSAQNRLADALGSSEISLSDPARPH
jgi:SAM-dependent methyltransferase